jgi:hypothetical protein
MIKNVENIKKKKLKKKKIQLQLFYSQREDFIKKKNELSNKNWGTYQIKFTGYLKFISWIVRKSFHSLF